MHLTTITIITSKENEMKKEKPIRQYALITIREEWKDQKYEDEIFFDDRWGKKKGGQVMLIYLGEIPNMEGHCVVIGHLSKKIYSGFHTDIFRELTEEET